MGKMKVIGGELELEALVKRIEEADEPTVARLTQGLGTADIPSTIDLIRKDKRAAKVAAGILGPPEPAQPEGAADGGAAAPGLASALYGGKSKRRGVPRGKLEI